MVILAKDVLSVWRKEPYNMTNHTEKIESIQAELSELEKMYHTITDMACEHFYNVNITFAIQRQVIHLTEKLRETKEEQKQYEAERALEDSKEFNPEDK